MKTLVISAISLCFAVSAHAEVKPDGTVLASRCSENIRVLGIVPQKGPSAVCYANIIGQRGNFMTIDQEVWREIARDRGQTRIQLVGVTGERGQIEWNTRLNVETAVVKKEGNGDGITVQEADIVFRAADFHVVYHTE